MTGTAPAASIKQATVPSPPSATGMVTTWQSGKNRGMTSSAILPISPLESVPLKESDTTTHFFIA